MIFRRRRWMPAATLTGIAACVAFAADHPQDPVSKLRSEWRALMDRETGPMRSQYAESLLKRERELADKGDYFGAARARKARKAVQPAPGDIEKTAPTVPAAIAEGQPVVLELSAALVNGGVKYDSSKGVLLDWTTAGAVARWLLPPGIRAGGYRVELTWSCPPDGGGEFLLKEDFHSLRRKVTPTGDWDTWRMEVVGTLRLLSNSRLLELSAAAVQGPGLLQLKSIRLLPASGSQ